MTKGKHFTHTRVINEEGQSHQYWYWNREIVAIKRLK